MSHEYNVDVESGSKGQVETYKVVVKDHQHHTLMETATFFATLGGLLGLPSQVIKTARWVRKL